MKQFLDEHFLLKSRSAQELYHRFAREMPIVDYHCHLSPKDIAEDRIFNNISEVWLHGDHYKWRAMRTNGVHESYCTGDQPDKDKFIQWARTVPYTLRNPLYHWTHMELSRYFGINELLCGDNAERIYDQCSNMLRSPDFSVQHLLKKMNVQLVCTTDDPTDSLEYHKKLLDQGAAITMVPAFRPDQAMNVTNTVQFLDYIGKVEQVTNRTISNLNQYLDALKSRHDYFSEMGCRVSDHGLEEIYSENYSDTEVNVLFIKILNRKQLNLQEQRVFRSAMLDHFAQWDHEKGWVQQFHLGALRNNNSRMMAKLGPDTGWDSIGNFDHGKPLARFLDNLDKKDKLAKTILYNLNPADNELMASMIGNFNDGSIAGKLQFGSGWWFLDQKDGIIRQLNALSNLGLLSRFIGMLTDSRSFLSFPRHEYFRRVLCDLLGNEIEDGELPNEIEWVGKVVQDICYYNNLNYFGWKLN